MAVVIRMCIGCRERFEQKTLHRFICNNKEVSLYKGRGRSFYICDKCIESKNIDKKINKVCKNRNIDLIRLREIVNI